MNTPCDNIVILKNHLARYMEDNGVKKVWLAKKLEVVPREIERILDYSHNTKFETLERALALVGLVVTIKVSKK